MGQRKRGLTIELKLYAPIGGSSMEGVQVGWPKIPNIVFALRIPEPDTNILDAGVHVINNYPTIRGHERV